MKKLYSEIFRGLLLLLSVIALNTDGLLAATQRNTADTSKIKPAKPLLNIKRASVEKPSFVKSGIKFDFTPFKPAAKAPAISGGPVKTLDPESKKINVVVFPNPIEDQELNLSYHVNKDSYVSIKIMDILGNEISTLLPSTKIAAGEQISKFTLSSRIGSGIYFLRLVVGNESVVKRISVL